MSAVSHTVEWKLHLSSSPDRVYAMLATDEGRLRFWAEEAVERDGVIAFHFPNGATYPAEILDRQPGRLFRLRYYGDSKTTFLLADDGQGGTDLHLVDEGVDPAYREEVLAGWVSVLMALKGAVDFDVDLRNHDPRRTWDAGFADN